MNTRGRPRHPEVLTPRQQEVLALLRRGLTNEEIARELNISPDGVKFHVSDILRRLHVESRHEAAAWQPEPVRPRWAMLLAPIFAIKKLHLGAVGYAVAAAITGAAAVGVALLVWGVMRTSRYSDTAPQALARTGVPEVDRAIDLLVHRDVDGLMQLVQYGPIGCSVTQTVGSPPPCAPGQPDGDPVDVFPMGACEGTYATSTDQVRQAFGLALLRQPSAAVFAVARDNTEDRTEDAYWIAITQDRPSQATAGVSFWNVNSGGKLVGLQNECGPIGAAQQVAYRFPADGHPDFVLGPIINCSPPPGQTANFMVTVDGLIPGSVLPQFWGEAKSTLGEDSGERAIVTVGADTAWNGDINRLEDVRQGMELEAVGVRQPDCTIVAQTILTPAPNALHSDARGIDVKYPFNWHEGAPAMPYASCTGCTVLGPTDVRYPYGVSIFEQPPSPGCTVRCYCQINCVSAGAETPQALSVGQVDASQVEVLRQPPLDGSGETTPYHEIWTLVPRSDHALLLVWFFRDGDAVGEGYVRHSMQMMLQSLALLPPP
jgi:DNA-binding CsgD family transcriptional regulator